MKSCIRLCVIAWLLAFAGSAAAAERIHASYAAPNASQSPLWAAQARGYFAKYGLEVDLLYISSGSLNVQALVGNTVQFAAGGPAALEARLRGPKLLTIANPLNVLASNLTTAPDVKSIADLKGRIGGISRFGSSTHQGLRYLFRTNGLSVENDLKMLQLGGDSSRLAALKAGKIQYTFLGAAASEQARSQGLKVLATAQQMNIPFPWTSVVVNEPWLEANRDTAYRYVKAVTEAIHFMKRNRAESEKMIAKYMRIDDPRLASVEYDFNVGLFPDLPYPTLEGMKLILENLAAETPEFARHKPEEFADGSLVERLKRERFLESLR
jgi:ABC-type nitrate/sulfonate/bicarbonate transport system substrate-binding protein